MARQFDVIENNITSFVGGTATLSCRTADTSPPTWSYRGWPEVLANSQETDVVDGWVPINGHAKRSSVEGFAGGYNFILNDLTYEDAGVYKCTTNGGQAKEGHATALYVKGQSTSEQRQAIGSAIGATVGVALIPIIVLLFLVNRHGRKVCNSSRTNRHSDTDIELTPCDRAGGELEEEVLVVNEQTEVHHNVYCFADNIPKFALIKYCLLMIHNCTPGDTAEKRVADTYMTIAGTCQAWRDVIAHCYKQIRGNSYGPYRISPKMDNSFIFKTSPSNEVTGMAYLHNLIYVTHWDSNTLTTWDCSNTNATITREFTVAGMKKPVAIVACPSMSMLYIVDAQKPPCIWKVVPHGETTPFEQFALHTDDKYEQLYGVAPNNGRGSSATGAVTTAPVSISIRNKYLLITAPSLLFKYNASDCFWLEDISLPANMVAFHAVETVESTFVVCHGPAVECKEISEIDRNCNILRSFGFASHTHGYPRHLVVDGDGRIFVNDNTNGKIFILNRELKFPLEYVSNIKDNNYMCTSMCLDSESGCLVVGERRSCVVRVFHVRKSPPSKTTDKSRLPWLNANHSEQFNSQ